MTHDEILSMTSEQLREAIAQAKGYTLKHSWMDAACINPIDYWVTPEGRLTTVLPDWTTNIADAWELVKDVFESGGEVGIRNDQRGYTNEIYEVSILSFNDGPGNGTGWSLSATATAPTAALAISRAWLMWEEKNL